MTDQPKRGGKKALGNGISLRDWLNKPERIVTREDLWAFWRVMDRVRQRADERAIWYVRLWRWLRAPLLPRKAPSTPPPSP